MLRSLVRAVMPAAWYAHLREAKRCYFDLYAQRSYSQEGEDLILGRIFSGKQQGYYVDVGACHPMRFSNTYRMYKRGWRGINLDAMPGSMTAFKKWRPNDVNLEIPISDSESVMQYYAFNEPALNGFSQELSEKRLGLDSYRLLFKKDLATRTLESVLDEHLPSGTKIDFLSVDVEGLDLNVLKSNNWAKYAPPVVLVEMLHCSLDAIVTSEISTFMREHGYFVISKTFNTVFFSNDPAFVVGFDL